MMVHAQYTLPKPEVLAQKGIQKLTIHKTPVRYLMGAGTIPVDTNDLGQTQALIRYYFNSFGKIDSVYHYPTDSGYFKKDILRYDSLDRLVEIKTIDRDGKVMNRSLVQSMDSAGCWYSASWSQGVLKYEHFITADSIVFKYIMYRGSERYPSHMVYRYDFEQEMRSETWFNQGEMTVKRSWQWIAFEGRPQRFIFQEYLKEGEPDPDVGIYEVDSSGMVINDQNGFFTDPFMSHNYYERFREFKGIQHAHQSLMNQDSLPDFQLHKQLWTFDGTRLEVRYDFNYQ